ncbi:SDR family NAD(P)-dependent oxidoreductase [Chloroflexota bacterium]
MTIDFAKYGPCALITGAAGGQGKCYARYLAADGFDLILVDINLGPMEKLRDELVAHYKIDIQLVQLDLAREDSVDRLISAIGDKDVSLVISNAGWGHKGEFESFPLESVMAVFNVITRVPLLLMHKLLPRLKARGRGGIILVGSMEGELPTPWSAVYGASKAFVHRLGFALFGELEGTGVDLLVLAPGVTDTDAIITAGLKREQFLDNMMSPEEVTRLALEALGRQPMLVPGEYNQQVVEALKGAPLDKAIAGSARGTARAIETARPGTIPGYSTRYPE